MYPVIFCFAITATFMIGKLRRALWGGGETRASTDARVEQYHLGIPLILKHPWGYGIGQGGGTLGYAPFGFLTIDTYYLVLALEYGVVGFVVYLSFIGFGIWGAGKELLTRGELVNDRGLMAPLAIALLNFIVIKSVFAQQDNHSVAFMMMGMIVAISSQSKTSNGPAGPRFIHNDTVRSPNTLKPQRS
jgi:hypothetical protein